MTEFDREIAELAARYGEPLRVDAPIHDGFFDPIHNPDRVGEVCMVVRRPNGKILLSIKTFYPRGAYRLPTGGIHHGERILDALRRETAEETGLETQLRRFLAAIHSRGARGQGPPLAERSEAWTALSVYLAAGEILIRSARSGRGARPERIRGRSRPRGRGSGSARPRAWRPER